MIGYFDSSFVLSAILEERPAADHSPWDMATERLSSDLLRLECWVAIRRAAEMQPADTPDTWLSERMNGLDRFFQRIAFKKIDDSIEAIVRRERALSQCRTLDAIHVATGLYSAPHLDEPLVMCTFDRRFRAAAQQAGFAVHPRA